MKLLVAMLTMTVLAVAGGAADAPYLWSSTARPPTLTRYPRLKSALTGEKVEVDGRKVVRYRQDPAARHTLYGTYANAFARGATAPGTLRTTLRGRFVGAATQAKLTLNLRAQGKGNGSAGVCRWDVPIKNEWHEWRFYASVAPETVALQYVFSFDGPGDACWEIESVTFDYAPDSVKTVAATPAVALPPSRWPKAATLNGFFSPGDGAPVAAQTAVRLTYDDRNLYVGFIADEPDMAALTAKITARDGALWNDDCVELFVYDAAGDVLHQFILNAVGARFDCRLRQAQAGDPYKPVPWDGVWSGKTWKNAESWEAVFTVPWATLGYEGAAPEALALNCARERQADRVLSQWNCYLGQFNAVPNFATWNLRDGVITRYRKLEKIHYVPTRKNPRFAELLGTEPGNWQPWIWGSEFYRQYLPPAIRKQYTLETFGEVQRRLLDIWGQAGVAGPNFPYVDLARNTVLGRAALLDAHRRSGITFPYSTAVSHDRAVRLGARPMLRFGDRVSTDPAAAQVTELTVSALDAIAARRRKEPELGKLVAFLHGVDEPTNRVPILYSVTRNPEAAAFLAEFSETLKKDTGFGKYGLYDEYGKPGADYALERIAFWRRWNREFARALGTAVAHAANRLPGVAYLAFNRNTCSGIDDIDVAAMSAVGKFRIGCDPYPTSARMYFGMGRALYHTGFSTKLLKDLTPGCETAVYVQGFNYCGGTPSPRDAREWAAQALKNGMDKLMWYCQTALYENPALYNELLNISRRIAAMPKLKLPTATATAVYYSDYDRWGLNDKPGHAVYTTYALLGEKLGSWFRFVSASHLALENIRMLYVPRLRFTDPALTAQLMAFVKNGGTLVVFDPDFLRFNIDGSAVPERAEIFGTELSPKPGVNQPLRYGRKALPLSAVQHLNLPDESGRVHAFDFVAPPADASILATYADGKPAIMARSFGRGKLILSAVQPFGGSEAALAPEGWLDFVRDLAGAVGEPTGLPIWSLELPEVKTDRLEIKPLL